MGQYNENGSKSSIAKQEPSTASAQTSGQDLPPSNTPRKARRRRQRQSLSAISNNSILTNDGAEISSSVASRISREKLAWETINAEISEWQTVCRTGRPSWWSPASRWTRQRRARTREGRDLANMEKAECDDGDDNCHTPAQRFEQLKKASKGTWDEGIYSTQEQAFVTAVQLLSVSFTVPVKQFENYKNSNLYFSTLASSGVRDARLISSLRMHTDYRWSPAFGHEARSSSPEYFNKSFHSGEVSLPSLGHTPVAPEVRYSGGTRRRRRKRRRRKARYATPADTSGQEHVGNVRMANSVLPLSALSSIKGSLGGSTRHSQAQSHIATWRRTRSCPVSPTLGTTSVKTQSSRPLHQLSTGIEGEEPSKEFEQPRWRQESSRYTLEPALRSEPHPVFIQPVKELVVKSWQTFRKKFGYTLSRGCPDPAGTSAPFVNEHMSLSWPSLGGPLTTSRAVQRRRYARERHDIYSGSVESSPRYNSPTSETLSDSSSQICLEPGAKLPDASGPVLLREPVNVTKTNEESASPSQSVSVLSSNNTSDADSESSSPRLIPRNAAGFFISKAAGNGPSHTLPGFVPLRGTKRRAAQRSTLSEIFTVNEIQEIIEAEQLTKEGNRNNWLEGTKEPSLETYANSLIEKTSELELVYHKLKKCRSLDTLTQRRTSSEFSNILSGSVDDCCGNNRALYIPATDSEERGLGLGWSRLQRMSSTGTTVLTPSDDGVEVDGFPTGPSAEIWGGKDRKGKRRARSFL